MKIFIVCSRLGYGGAERVAMMWANGFVNRGHEVLLISNLYEDVTYTLDERVKVRSLITSIKSKERKWIGAVKNLRKLTKEENPNVIITVMRLCSMVAKIATLGLGIPIVATEHNAYEWPSSNPMPLQARLFKFYLSKYFEKVTVLTQADKTLIGERLSNVVVMPNPLSLEPIETLVPKRGNNILAVGRLDAWKIKGFDVLIRAWAYTVSRSLFLVSSEGWKLQIAGTGSKENMNYLKQLCKENGVEDSVEFLGFRKNIEKLYQNASIFVLSSRYEGFGLVLIEAMSQGCACVACDYKGRQREIIAPLEESEHRSKFNVQSSNSKFEACENGILCEPDDVEALAAGIQKMIEDNGYREGVRSNAVERSKYYTIEKIMTRWEQLFISILS